VWDTATNWAKMHEILKKKLCKTRGKLEAASYQTSKTVKLLTDSAHRPPF